jgi:glutamate-1-semialdehyde 2,1-aminomutase
MPNPGEPSRRPLRLTRDWWRRARAVVPGGTHTISKRVGQFAAEDCFPALLVRGHGALVWDPDGNEYIDYIAALAPVILGHAHPEVNAAIRAQLEDGILLSLPAPAEIELAEKLCRLLPCAERIRFFKTGAEATSAAVRVARLVTGRDRILTCGYHGWHDWWTVTKSRAGIPPALASFTTEVPFGDPAAFDRKFAELAGELAAVIVTPAVYGRHPPAGFLETLRQRTAAARVPLVFDEIITGFRWGLTGAQGRYGVVPDLACFGKSLANGLPLAALAGNAEWMDPIADNWVSSTYAGELLSIRAALATLAVLERPGFYEGLHAAAARLQQGLAEIGRRLGLRLVQGDALPALVFRPEVAELTLGEMQSALLAEAARRGVLLRRDPEGISLCLMAAHTDDLIARTLDALEGALSTLQASAGR